MKKKRVPTPLYTVGVRFLSGDISKVWTYRIRRDRTVHLGQELIADTPRGSAVVVVVRIDKTRQDIGPHEYKFLTRKIVPL